HQQVIVVTHQPVGVNLPAGLLARLTQRLQKALPVPVILENLLPAVATGHHVIHRFRILNAKGTCHCALTLRSQANHRQSKTVIILGLTPSFVLPYLMNPDFAIRYEYPSVVDSVLRRGFPANGNLSPWDVAFNTGPAQQE